jgi:2-(1,2-epoxy-1,2-dihydrophenyl)acetyl-CoA isomerase
VSQEVGSADGAVIAHRDGAILRLTLDRPARRNSLSHPMIDTFVDALTKAASDDSFRAIHIRGEGDDFCAGAHWVATNSTGRRPRTGDLVRRIPHTSHRLVELIATIQLPVVCTVRGWAVGLGCNLALAADFPVAADDAVFWEPFVTRGFSPDSGATWLQAIHYGQHATLAQTMNQELFNLELSCRTTDFKEGLAAFRDRRTPEFEGR